LRARVAADPEIVAGEPLAMFQHRLAEELVDGFEIVFFDFALQSCGPVLAIFPHQRAPEEHAEIAAGIALQAFQPTLGQFQGLIAARVGAEQRARLAVDRLPFRRMARARSAAAVSPRPLR
jgi:hypothetical protein